MNSQDIDFLVELRYNGGKDSPRHIKPSKSSE
jgi:hypothetical protein